ncbi:MAG: amidohydrolase family protein [Planctomycetota bacterium]
MLIDSHHHLWRYSAEQYPWIGDGMEVLAKDYWCEELQKIGEENAVEGFVTVQARQSLTETEILLTLAEHEPMMLGVVGWLDLRSPELPAQLERYGKQPMLKGVRHVVQDEPDPDFLLGDAFQAGVRRLQAYDLTYDVLIFARQLPAAVEFAANHDNLRLVLDHIAKPTIRGTSIDDDYVRLMRKLAGYSHVSCKFSGVVTEVRDESWDIETIRPYWKLMLELFGPSRLMFGSDWPVCLLKSEYDRWLETVKQLASDLSESEREAIFSENAQRAYKLHNERLIDRKGTTP